MECGKLSRVRLSRLLLIMIFRFERRFMLTQDDRRICLSLIDGICCLKYPAAAFELQNGVQHSRVRNVHGAFVRRLA
jgi:hypothetical protein